MPRNQSCWKNDLAIFVKENSKTTTSLAGPRQHENKRKKKTHTHTHNNYDTGHLACCMHATNQEDKMTIHNFRRRSWDFQYLGRVMCGWDL